MRTRNIELNNNRRVAILQAASNCFVENGFHATSMKEICVAAGMSPGTLYHYYGSKAEIIIGIIEDEQRSITALLAGVTKAPDVFIALFEAFDFFTCEVTERDLILHAEVAAEILRREDLKQAAIAADLQVEAQLATALRQGQSNGQLDASLDPAQAARTILTLIDGILIQAALHGAGVMAQQMPALRQAVTRMLIAPNGAR